MGPQLDRLGVVDEGVGDLTVVAIVIRQVVPNRRLHGIDLFRPQPLLQRALLIVGLLQKAAKGDSCPGVFGMLLKELLIRPLDGGQPSLYPVLEAQLRQGGLLGLLAIAFADHVVDLAASLVVHLHDALELRLQGVAVA